MINTRDSKGRFLKGFKHNTKPSPKGWTNSGSFTSENTKGAKNPFYGKKHTQESKEKISKNNGVKNNPEVRKKISKALKGRKLSEETKQKMSIAQKKRVKLGLNNFWKGGISKYYQKLSKSLRNSEWRNWRSKVFKRDNYTCQICGLTSGNGKAVILEPHHIIPVKKCIENNWFPKIYDIKNGLTLCKECHKNIHKNSS